MRTPRVLQSRLPREMQRAWSRRLLPGAAKLGRTLAIYGLLGAVAGLVGLAFVTLVHEASDLLIGAVTASAAEAVSLPFGDRWWLLVLPATGGLLSGMLCAWLAPEAMGAGTDAVIDAYLNKGGEIRRRVPLVKSVASALTIGSGGSAGLEGPVGFVAGGIGSIFGRVFKLSSSEKRILVMAGFAAGIGAVFHAPMAASIFSAEVLYRDLDIEHEVLVPSIIASTVAYAVFGAVAGWGAIWELPPVAMRSVVELLPYLILALVCAAGGIFFIKLNRFVAGRFQRAGRLPLWLRPALGGLGVGLVGLFIPDVTGVGYGLAQLAIDGRTTLGILLLLAFAKMITSSLTTGSGGSGGLFAPSLVIGGVLGGAVAVASNAVAPALGADPAAFTVVGMAGFFAAVVNAPISTVIMVSELVGSYHILVPTLWVCIIAWFTARRHNLYPQQVESRMTAPVHIADMMSAVLRRITVRDAREPGKPAPVTVAPDARLRELVSHFAHTIQGVFPVVDPKTGAMLGVIDGWELRRTIGAEGVDGVLVAADFLAPALTATLDDALDEVVAKMSQAGFDEVVIVDEGDTSRLVGVLSRREIVSAYHREMLAASEQGAEDAGPVPEADDAPLDVAAALDRGGVYHALKGRTREEVLASLIERLKLPEAVDRNALVAQLLDREQLGTTCIGDGVAFPHPSSTGLEGIDAPIIAVGTPRRPIPWGRSPLPDQPAPQATIIVLLLAPRDGTHLEVLAAMARALREPSVRHEIRKHASSRHVIEHIAEVASRR